MKINELFEAKSAEELANAMINRAKVSSAQGIKSLGKTYYNQVKKMVKQHAGAKEILKALQDMAKKNGHKMEKIEDYKSPSASDYYRDSQGQDDYAYEIFDSKNRLAYNVRFTTDSGEVNPTSLQLATYDENGKTIEKG